MIKDVIFTENRLGQCDLSTYVDDFGEIGFFNFTNERLSIADYVVAPKSQKVTLPATPGTLNFYEMGLIF